MRKIRRHATVGVALVAAGLLVGGPALAQSTATETSSGTAYDARATAEALKIVLFGTEVTGSTAVAALDGTPVAGASATEVFLGPVSTGEAEARVENVDGTDENTTDCATGLEAIPGVGRFDVTCPTATASIADGLPSASGLGAQAVIDASASELLDTIGLQEPVNDIVDETYEQLLDPLVAELTGNPIGDLVEDTTITLRQLLTEVLNLETTARIVVAPALAEVDATADQASASAQAQGLRIELLPADVLSDTNNLLPADLEQGEPLITIIVGEAKASKTIDRATGDFSTEQSAALVTVKIGTLELLETLGLASQEIALEVGQSLCLLEDTLLETCITVADSGVDANGTSWADGTSIQIFKGVGESEVGAGDGGVDLTVGRVTAGASITPAAEAPQVDLPVELPRTGGDPMVPLAGAALLGLAVGVRRLVRRSAA
ncbi:MAG TPA: hypothetical protein VMN58_01040 [Acidimicrobiales bacterium]|nr:hypothetical protein [Acidimicrobiales bacterium]